MRARSILLPWTLLALAGCEGPSGPPLPPTESCATATLLPPVKLSLSMASPAFDDQRLGEAAAELASRLSVNLRRWHEQAAEAPVDCADPAELLTYQLASLATDQPEQCLAIAERCLPPSGPLSDAEALLAFNAALCADRQHRLGVAHASFRRALDPANELCADQEGRVFAFAYFARTTQYEHEVAELLRSLGWGSPKVTLAEAAIDFLAGRDPTASPEVEAFLLGRLADGGRTWQSFGLPLWLRALSLGVEKADLAVASILRNPQLFELFPGQSVVASTLHHAFFISSAGKGPALAETIYREYFPWAKASSFLPLEHNSRTYTELYQSVCRETLLAAEGRAALGAIASSWRQGEKPAGEALQLALDLQRGQGDKADLLTFIAYLRQRTGQREEAQALYLRAHQACPFYQRAHWGLRVLDRWRRVEAHDDFPARRASLQAAADRTPAPPRIGEYVDIDVAVPAPERNLFITALGLWLPYLPSLIGTGNQAHLKHGYQLLSEIEGLEYLRDQRVEYDNDYRLYDDLRGVGGVDATADLDATLLSFHAGDVNILFHEVAHQLHQAAPESFRSCIKRLYEEARVKNSFPSYYAGRNEREYLAVGAECFLIPADAPLRYGKNRGWLDQADPKLVAVLEQIERGTELALIQCP